MKKTGGGKHYRNAICVGLLMISITTVYGDDFEKDVLLVKLKPTSFSLTEKGGVPTAIKALEIESFCKVGLANKKGVLLQNQAKEGDLLKINLKPGQDIEGLAKTLSSQPGIEYAEPSYKVEIMNIPNDSDFQKQTYLSKTSLQTLWQWPVLKQIIVAVVDTGVDYTHEDLVEVIVQNDADIPNNGIDDDGNGFVDDHFGYNFYNASNGKGSSDPMDEQSHGTHLAGIIAAQTNNNLGIAGINPDAKILPVRFLDSEGSGSQLDGALAIRYAVDRGATIINCSWGYYKLNTVLDDAIRYAVSKGVTVVAAVGNTNTNIIEYPSGCEGVIGVSSATLDNSKAPYASFGPQVDFMTYGSKLYSTLPKNQYGVKSGTSQATAVMSGIISRILAYNPTLSADDLYALLKNGALNGDKKDVKNGYGVIEAPKLLSVLESSQNPIDDPDTPINTTKLFSTSFTISKLMNYPNPIRNHTTFGFDSDVNGAEVTIAIYDLNGYLIDTLYSETIFGYNKLSWDPSDLNNGTYLYVARIKKDGYEKAVKGKLAVLR